jgi:hypothetical protein
MPPAGGFRFAVRSDFRGSINVQSSSLMIGVPIPSNSLPQMLTAPLGLLVEIKGSTALPLKLSHGDDCRYR